MLTDHNFGEKKTWWTRTKLVGEKKNNTEYVYTRFDSCNSGMTRHKLYVLREINVYTYYRNYKCIWENLSLFINMLFVKAPCPPSVTIPITKVSQSLVLASICN